MKEKWERLNKEERYKEKKKDIDEDDDKRDERIKTVKWRNLKENMKDWKIKQIIWKGEGEIKKGKKEMRDKKTVFGYGRMKNKGDKAKVK